MVAAGVPLVAITEVPVGAAIVNELAPFILFEAGIEVVKSTSLMLNWTVWPVVETNTSAIVATKRYCVLLDNVSFNVKAIGVTAETLKAGELVETKTSVPAS